MNKHYVVFCVIFFLAAPSVIHPGYEEKNMLRVGISTFPGPLNPFYATSEASQSIINKIFDSLYSFDSEGNITENLVKRSELNPIKQEVSIELKRNIYFSDGKELDSEDVFRTVKLMQNKNYCYPYLSVIQALKEIRKTGKYTLKIGVGPRLAYWKNLLTFKILNSNEIKNVDPKSFRFKSLSGTGPYCIKTIKEPVHVILEINRFPSSCTYSTCADSSRMYRVIDYTVVSNSFNIPLKLMNDEIDICELQPEIADAYRENPSWQEKFNILKYKKFGYTYLVFNLRNPKIHPKLRNTLYNQLIGGDFLDYFLERIGERVSSPFLSKHPQIPFRIYEPDCKENDIHLKVLTNAESKLRMNFILFLKEQLKSFHIILEPVFVEYHVFLNYLKNGQFDIAVSGFLLDKDGEMNDIFSSTSSFNYAHFISPEMERLLEEASREIDPVKREKIFTDAYYLWRKHLPFIPLFNLYYYVGVSKKIAIPSKIYSQVGAEADFLYNIHEWKQK